MTTTLHLINRGTGSVKVHKHNCKDVKRETSGASVWTADVSSYVELVWDVYPPDDFSYDADAEWGEFDDLEVCNCAKKIVAALPVHPNAVPAEETTTSKRRPQINHRECQHAQTPAARRACRKAYWSQSK